MLASASPATAQISQQWIKTVDGLIPDDDVAFNGRAASLALDADENAYVAATTTNEDGEQLALLVKYAPDGTVAWSETLDGPDEGDFPYFRDVVTDDAQNVIVTGYILAANAQFSTIVTRKYDGGDGSLLWSATYNALAQGDAIFDGRNLAIAVFTDAESNVYVGGTSAQQGTSFSSDDFILIKYDTDGNQLWYKTYDSAGGSGEHLDHLYGMTADAVGNAYLIGTANFSGNTNFATVHYRSDGNLSWEQFYDTEELYSADFDQPAAVALDGQGNVIVTGTIQREDTGRDYLTIKYHPDGDTLWTARYDNGNPALRYNDWAHDVIVADDGSIYVTGRSQQADDSYDDYLTVKYSASGDTLWTRRYNGPANEHDVAYALALDADQKLYVIGNTGLTGGSADSNFGILIYSSEGDSLGFIMKEPPTNGIHDYPTAGLVGASGNLYVTGYQELFSSAILTTVKYAPADASSISPVSAALPRQFALHASYPNPFNPSTVIPFDVKATAHVRLTVYDPLGRKVAQLVDERLGPGQYEALFNAPHLASGIYLYMIEMAGFSEARKMHLVK